MLFKNHRGELCLYVVIDGNCLVIKDNTYEIHNDFYWIPIKEYVADKTHWHQHLLEKNWGTPELLREIENQLGVVNR